MDKIEQMRIAVSSYDAVKKAMFDCGGYINFAHALEEYLKHMVKDDSTDRMGENKTHAVKLVNFLKIIQEFNEINK